MINPEAADWAQLQAFSLASTLARGAKVVHMINPADLDSSAAGRVR